MTVLGDLSSTALLQLLVRLLLGGALVLVAASALARCSKPGLERQRVWSGALALLLLLPALSVALPSISIPLPILELGVLGGPPADSGGSPADDTSILAGSLRGAALSTEHPGARPQGPAVASASSERSLATAPSAIGLGVAAGLGLLWAAGATLLLAAVVRSQLALRRLARRARDVTDPAWRSELDALCRELALERSVRLIADPSVRTPMTWGLRSPVIAVPAAAESWSARERRVVLLHELAHVARRDAPRLLAARLACILHWPDPLAWRALGRLAVEHELACDRRVLDHGVRPSSYARQLVSLARHRTTPHLSGALAMARRTSLEVRVLSILDPGSSDFARGARRRSLVALAALVLIAGGIAMLTPSRPAEAVVRAPLPESLPLVGGVLPASARRAIQPPQGEVAQSLSEVLTAAREVEAQMRLYEERMREVEREMERAMAPLEELEARLEPHEEELRRLELEQRRLAEPVMQLERELQAAHRDRLSEAERRLEEAHRALEREREPLVSELETLQRELERLVESAVEPLEHNERISEPVQRRIEEIQAQMEPLQRRIEELHRGMEPMQRDLEAAVRELEPRQRELETAMRSLEPHSREMEEVHRRMESVHREVERAHRDLEPFHRRMEEIHQAMEPLHRKMEEAHRRLERAVAGELRAVLARGLAELSLSDATLDRATEQVSHAVDIRIDDDRLRLRASGAELRELLAEVTGVAETHPAIEDTVEALLDLDTRIE